ncbi:hypothetical protein QTN47_04915 [Danxiaibacter flavus]|uniref:DoxX family protein n=1 Tax=Danxiaibacter flavus TaxID=3049108 RepID=A0ABV3ZEC4_9BACT|nr:hypothetical protein QNM32_04915 [Chitinophagaceae bacterium DXS]
MNKLILPGRVMFAIGIAGLAILCFVYKDFIVGRPPAWSLPFNLTSIVAYISGAILITASVAIIINKKGARASMAIAALIFIFSVLRHIPQFMNDWLNTYKSVALFGGALIVGSTFILDDPQRYTGNTQSQRNIFILTGKLFLSTFFVASGYAHFKFAGFVTDFIPAYIPFRTFWAYFCGVCLIAGGIGIFVPGISKWASLLSGIMLTGWFLLLHIPRLIAHPTDASDRMGLCESFTFAGIFFVLAGILWNKKQAKSLY